MKRAPVKATKSISHAGSTKTVSIRVSSGKCSVIGKASIKTK